MEAAALRAHDAGATLLFFVPSPSAENPAAARQETLLLIGETLATLGVGILLLPRRARTRGV